MRLFEETLSRHCEFQGKLLKLDVLEVRLPDGRTARREVVEHPHAVCAVVATAGLKTVLVRQFRTAVGETTLEVPAGKIDPQEAVEVAVLRELREEVGLQRGKLEKLLDFYSTPGFCTERMTCFLVTEAELAQAEPDLGEFLETVPMDLADAVQLAAGGGIQDAKSVVALLAAGRRLGL